MFKITSIIIATLLIGILGTVGQSAFADTIFLKSGDIVPHGAAPGTELVIRYLPGPAFGGWPAPFTAADFTNAQSGPLADIVVNHPRWTYPLPADTDAQWICNDPGCNSAGPNGVLHSGDTNLFAHPFNLCGDNDPVSAMLTFDFLVDNDLGDNNNEGVFINGVPMTGTKLLGDIFSHYIDPRQFGPFDITPHLTPGVNYMYVNQVERESQDSAAVIYSANFTFTCSLPIGGTVGSMDTASLLIAGTQANMDYWWIITLVGGIAGVGIVVKAKTNKTNKETL